MEQDIKITPGKLLYDARVAANLSRENVAEYLHLNVRVIHDLEADHYTSGNLVFMKGYLRACGKLLNIPAEELNAAFNNLGIEVKPSNLDIAPATSSQVSHVADVKVRKMAAIGGLILIIVVFLVWYIHYSHDKNQMPQVVKESTATMATETASPAPAESATAVAAPVNHETPKEKEYTEAVKEVHKEKKPLEHQQVQTNNTSLSSAVSNKPAVKPPAPAVNITATAPSAAKSSAAKVKANAPTLSMDLE